MGLNRKMNLNVNTALYNTKGVDVQSVASVSNRILANSQDKQATVQAIDYSKFNRATLGVDLYSNRTTPELQKQIALTQAGLYVQAINVAKLNSAAAQNLYSAATVQKNVELTQSVAEKADLESPKKVEENQNVIQLYNTQDKNPNSHNGFNPFRWSEEAAASEEGDKDGIDFLI